MASRKSFPDPGVQTPCWRYNIPYLVFGNARGELHTYRLGARKNSFFNGIEFKKQKNSRCPHP